MSEMQDKELDDLFRKSMSDPEIPFNLEAWKAMEAKLNKQERRRGIYFRTIGGSILGVMILIGSIWYFNKNDSTNDNNTFNSTKLTAKEDKKKSIIRVENNSLTDNSTMKRVESDGKAVINKKQYIQPESGKEQHLGQLKQSSLHSHEKSDISIRRMSGLAMTHPQSVLEKKITSSSPIIFNSIDSHFVTSKQGIANEKDNQTHFNQNNHLLMIDSSIYYNDLISVDPSDLSEAKRDRIKIDSNEIYSKQLSSYNKYVEDSSITKDSSEVLDSVNNKVKADLVKERDDNSKINKFSIGLIINPEYSSTTSLNFGKPGFNIGLSLEYYVSSRISILTGFLYARKVYSCDGYDYTSAPSYRSWGSNYVPSTVNATCAVGDIPISIRYKYLNAKTFNLYATTGVSSYIMLKENYHFEYAVKTPTSMQNEQVVNKNRYLFNMYNISFGIEKYINKRVSVQIEPYAKIPLAGIGEGKIKLVSTGVYFSLKYYFNK